MSETILLHFSGADHAGLTTELTGILADFRACVLDIGQAVVHETLALGLLIEVPSGRDFGPLKSALMAKAQALGLHVRFTPVSKEALDHWLAAQGKDRFLVTIL
ncbi:MAG: ACT domain-containing protein, partial [Silvibacterium sp.]